MFQSTLPQKAVKIIGNLVREWNCKRIFIGCSSNFIIERSISGIINCPITSNDVTIYSNYIGKYFANEDLSELKIKEDYNGKCNFLRDYMQEDVDKIATMILASDILPYSFADNWYFNRMIKGYEDQMPELHSKMCKKTKRNENESG